MKIKPNKKTVARFDELTSLRLLGTISHDQKAELAALESGFDEYEWKSQIGVSIRRRLRDMDRRIRDRRQQLDAIEKRLSKMRVNLKAR